MFRSTHAYAITVADDAGAVVFRCDMDECRPCYEALLFDAVRRGVVEDDGREPPATLAPVFEAGRMAGLDGSLGQVRKRFPVSVLLPPLWAGLAAHPDLREKLIAKNGYTWRLEAEERPPRGGGRLRLTMRRPPLAIQTPAEQGTGTGEIRIASAVVRELLEETAASPQMERADFLYGVLAAGDAEEVCAVVRGRIAARGDGGASNTHFAFSPLAFDEARRAVEERAPGQRILGWHHNHPLGCWPGCSKQSPPCDVSTLFFSLDDRVVHWTGFPAPYMMALVSGKGAGLPPDRPEMRAYGWSEGWVVEKKFSIF